MTSVNTSNSAPYYYLLMTISYIQINTVRNKEVTQKLHRQQNGSKTGSRYSIQYVLSPLSNN